MSSYTPTEAEIRMLRRRVGEAETDSTYTDSELSGLLAQFDGDQHAAAATVWEWKAAAAESLIDWSADGGSYQQAVLYERYKTSAEEERRQSPLLGKMIIDPTEKEWE